MSVQIISLTFIILHKSEEEHIKDVLLLPFRLLHSDRDAIPDVPAVYFVMPTEENIDRMCQVTCILNVSNEWAQQHVTYSCTHWSMTVLYLLLMHI